MLWFQSYLRRGKINWIVRIITQYVFQTKINAQRQNWLCETKTDPREHQENTTCNKTSAQTQTGATDIKSGCRESAPLSDLFIFILSTFKVWLYTTIMDTFYLKSTVIRLDVKPMESRLRGVLCEGTRPFADFSLKISDNLWWQLKSSRSSSKPLLLPHMHKEATMSPHSTAAMQQDILSYTTGEDSSPVVCFGKIVLHQDLVDSHHQDGVDIILDANAASRRELG